MPTIAHLNSALGSITIQYKRGTGFALSAEGLIGAAFPLSTLCYLMLRTWGCALMPT